MSTLSGNQRRKMRSAARLYAVQALFQMEHSGQSVDAVRQEFLNFRFGAEVDDGVEMADGDMELFQLLLEQAVNWQARIDQMTDRALVAKWPIDRIDSLELWDTTSDFFSEPTRQELERMRSAI